MPYELEFIGVKQSLSSGNADAICFRWQEEAAKSNTPLYQIGVFDGGYAAHGRELAAHLNRYYFDDPHGEKPASQKVINYVFVSHPDQDHVTGLRKILEDFKIEALYMNRPWMYIDELWDKVKSGWVTKKSLREHFYKAFANIRELETIALEHNIPIKEAFTSEVSDGRLYILSPTREFYLKLLTESQKLPDYVFESLFTVDEQAAGSDLTVDEDWETETLRESEPVTAENESSIVLLGNMEEESFLLTGDAGTRALDASLDFMEGCDAPIKDCVDVYQIPHHGGRHNLSPEIMDRLVGDITDEHAKPKKIAYVSSAEGSVYPRKMVTNAFIRRGAKVYKTNGSTIRHSNNMPTRGTNWAPSAPVPFSHKVEKWNNE